MNLFAPRRLLTPRGPAWRCLQQVSRAPACLVVTGQQNLYSDSTKASVGTSLFLRPVPTNGLLSLQSPSGPTSRLCHGRQSGNPEREDGGNATNEGFSMRALSQAPRPALYLGFAGLVPFLSAPLLMAATQSFYPEVAYGQMVYGACIVSFLGGARWGFALPESSPAKPDWMNLGNSVVPSLLAWLALLCKDNITEGALVVIMGLGLSLHYDLTLLPGYPGWFKAMRTVLTLVATFSLVATLTMKKCCTEKKLKELQN